MNFRQPSLLFVLLLTAASATAQITGSGTSGYVPVFTGTSTIGNSTAPPIFLYNGNVGIGTYTAVSPLELFGITTNATSSYSIGIKSSLYASPSAASTTFYTGLWAQGINNGAQTMSGSWGSGGLVGTVSKAMNQGTGTVVNAYGIIADVQNISTGAITNSYTMYVPNPYVTNGSIANAYGLYIKNITSGTSTKYSLYVEGANSYFGSNVGIGTTTPGAKLEINGGLRFSTDPTGTVQTTAWTGVLCGGDYAEAVDVIGDRTRYEPGDVLVIDPDHQGKFLKSSDAYFTGVTGVYSTKPGVLGRREGRAASPDEVPMAMIGIVPTKVSAENGPIRPGDLLVTSSRLGYAMKGTDRSRMLGAVIGKALGSVDFGMGVIEVAITLQ